MATITDTTTDANGNIIINVSSSADDAITLATAGTYSDKNIIFNITTQQSDVQPDWNQNDSTAADYVKNRPFYTGDPVKTALVEEITVPFSDFGDGLYMGQIESTFSVTVGETYKVSWDGSTYECTCVDIEGTLAFGNLSIAGAESDTGEPFLIVYDSEGVFAAGTADTSASHTISISMIVSPVVKIDAKYLPDNPLFDITGAAVDQIAKISAVDEVGNPTEWETVDISNFAPAPFKPAGKSYLTFSSSNSFTLKVNDATKHWDGTLEYFSSDKTWTTWDGTNILSAVADDGEYVLCLRGTGNTIITGKPNSQWVLTGSNIACIGNIENLLDYATVKSGAHPAMKSDCYSYMFSGCTSLTQAPALPATTLANNCYGSMFFNCTSLTQAPVLPATTLAKECYGSMFSNCKSLTQAPALPATTLADSCYCLMFSNCKSLTRAPALPATTLADSCYCLMFSDCTSLTQAPVLPATTLADSCYRLMFSNCKSLTQAPALPATTLAKECYGSMFSNCKSLTQAPALPATTLADSCYSYMFSGCTSLTQAPALPATTLDYYCYNHMFSNCTSFKLSSTKTDEYIQEYRIPSSGNGVTKFNSLTDMFTSTGGTFTETPSINTTYYLSSDNMIVRDTEIATLNGYVGSMINNAIPMPDTTLSITGKSADAKATGDAIHALSDEIVTTSESKVAAHNTRTDTHSDIRLLIQGLTDRLNALADSDDTTLDQLSEVVTYIKSNRSLIESITTSKVSVADIVDNLTTNVSNKPLSAAQGVAIKTLIDALRNDKLDAAELTNAVNTALAQAKASGEFDGADGAPGKDGIPGQDGQPGSDGVGIQSVVQTTTSTEDGGTNVVTVTKTDGTSSTFTVKNGSKGSTGATGADGYTPVKGVDYFDGKNGSDANVTAQNIASALGYTPANDADVESLSSNQSTLSARMDTFTALGEGSTTGDAELMDARVDCEGKTWANAGDHIRGITEKIIDACCDKVISGSENYNLLKTSEVTYKHRLQNDSEELVSSNEYNMVSGWIPVEYGKYYTFSMLYNGARATNFGNTESPISRIHVKLLDGSVLLIQQGNLRKNADGTGIPTSFSTIRANIPGMVAVRMQITMGDVTPYPSTEEIMKTYEPMFTSSDASTGKEAHNYALSLPYMDGDADGGVEISYKLKEDENKADKTEVETIKSAVSALSQRKVTASPKYNGNYIPNDRFLRGIANLRDSENAKEFEITIQNNSGATIKNAAIAVGMHNTIGINPNNNNLPFQVYDDVFSEPTGFKFYDGGTELPYYIESESYCNYIVDKNIKTDQKTMAVFSDGKIAVYNATKARMQLSADGGISWTNICDNITSIPYRVLLPDSQDNLFVASHDGKKLYKYTPADGYKAGTEVIDLTDTDTCIGSILAEDSEGNLYLGTYQTVFHCVVRKSTDHGNTWTIVFDVTNCQHVHNIFVNKKVTPNEIFIGLDNSSGETVETHVSTDAGATWTKVDVPYGNRDYAFRYAGENFYIGCGERLSLGGATLYKTTDYNDPNAYYPLFDNGQGIRDIINVIEGSDDVLIAGGCVDAAVHQQQLFLSADRGETWKTVLMNPHYADESPAGKGLRTFSRKGTQILSETNTGYCMRFVYGNGARTILAMVSVGDIPTSGKTITLKTGYVANIEQMDDVLTAYENIDGKVADIQICDGYIVDKVSNKRVMTDKTELVNSRIKIGQTSEYKILAESAYRLNDSVNLGKLSRLNFTKGFTVSLLFRKEDGKNYLEDYNEYPIFQSGNTKLVLYRRSLRLVSGSISIWGDKLYIQDSYLGSVNEDYVRLTAYFTADELPSAGIYTENQHAGVAACAEYPIAQKLNVNEFIVGSSLAGAPNIARIEIYNRVLTHGEIMALTNGCNLVTDGSMFN